MKRLRILLIISLLALEIGGGFAAWVYRSAVALQLTPPDLAEYVKFLPEMIFGQLPIRRLHFLLPLAVAALGMPFVAVNKALDLHWSLNWLLRLSVIPMALALLSPVWSPGVLLNSEFRLQTIVAGVAIVLAITAPIFKRLSLKIIVSLIAITATAATALALRQFWLVNDAIAATYAAPVSLGWGGWLTIVGTVGLLVSAGWLWMLSRNPLPKKR